MGWFAKSPQAKAANAPYLLYLLDHEAIAALDEDDPVLQPYAALTRSRPARVPPELQGSQQAPLFLARLQKQHRITKVKAAKLLYKNGCYLKAAAFSMACANDAVAAATSMNSAWWETDDSRVHVLGSPTRSVATHDIIFRFEVPFMKMPMGFINMKTGRYEDSLV